MLREFAVVAQRAVEHLQADVTAIQHVHDAHGMHVVVEIAPGALVVALRQEALAGVAERRVAQVVPQRDGLDQLAVQPQQPSDVARDAADQLHVQASAADIVVFHQAEHLRFAGVAVVSGNVDDLVDVAREGASQQRGVVVRVALAPHHVFIAKTLRMQPPAATVVFDCLRDFRVKRQVARFGHGNPFHALDVSQLL